MANKAAHSQAIDKLVVELRELRDTYHGFVAAVSCASDVNYNNLSSILSGKRKMGFHVFLKIQNVLPKVKREFSGKKKKKAK